MREDYFRTFALDDIQISRSHGDGRTVEAYAAVFDTPVEVKDRHGHYMEVIDRNAFKRTLSHGIGKVTVLYNHGMTMHGTPSDLGSVPIGRPLEIRQDGKGLFTVTRYNQSEMADAVLEAIRNGDIRGQSFRGQIFRSSPNGRVPRAKAGQSLPTVVRHELGLVEYGPTPIPVYEAAAITAVRSAQEIAEAIKHLDKEAVAALIETLASTHSVDSDALRATPVSAGLGSEDSPNRHSARQKQLRLRAELLTRGVFRNAEAE
ncbi:HK97 family phage prohead protease [Micromonospora sp. WMMD718]|uniref:HK97 family phage prohead protease n=1 Tax=unclassified Micromonospora TaxID=2617518 RepID=UPI00137933D5|nr:MULTISPECIES: HK97 family phage prohead protease [unclassified Micromonospora]MDG4750617.1 HK97 family phage prohead protease [Micromonospora sp. WMMD718]